MNEFTVGSLFAGIGGFDLGLERAGMRTVWQVEIDPFCRRVLERHFPDAERYEDVRDVGAGNLAPVDLICGGFPCQDISLAGRGAGIDGERSGLWSEMWRVIRELEPGWVVVENVPALTSRGLDRVLRDLAEGGYDAEWDCLPANAFGAPHRRDRLWVVAYARSDGCGNGERGQERYEGTARIGAGDVRELRGNHGSGTQRSGAPPLAIAGGARNGSVDLADAESNGRGQGRTGRSDGDGQDGQDLAPEGMAYADSQPPLRASIPRAERDPWATEPNVGRVANGVPARVDRIRSLGNALVPQIAEWIGRRIIDYEMTHQKAAA